MPHEVFYGTDSGGTVEAGVTIRCFFGTDSRDFPVHRQKNTVQFRATLHPSAQTKPLVPIFVFVYTPHLGVLHDPFLLAHITHVLTKSIRSIQSTNASNANNATRATHAAHSSARGTRVECCKCADKPISRSTPGCADQTIRR